MTNNSINNTVTNNDFSVNRSDAGTSCVHSVTHSNNTNTSSHAVAKIQSGGTSGGDAFARLSVIGGQDYSIGIDNTDSDALKITDNANPSSGNILWKMTTSGERTLPLNSGMLAFSALQSNFTGNVSFKNVPFAGSTTYDQNNNFDDSATFTAPVDGIYVFNMQINAEDAGTSTQGQISFLTTGSYSTLGIGYRPDLFCNSSGDISLASIVILELDAADTVIGRFQMQGAGSNIVDIAATSFLTGGLAL